jgi:hypothetical protein
MDTDPANVQFEEYVSESRKIRNTLIPPALNWYRNHLSWPFMMFRGAGVMTVIISVCLPTVTLLKWLPHHDLIVSLMSLTIAILTGLSSFYRWERTWRSRRLCLEAIEVLDLKWELEMSKARNAVATADRMTYVYNATRDLIANYQVIASGESEDFFNGLQFPQSGSRVNH